MITGFSMEWSFDAMTSMYMLDGEDVSPEKRAKRLFKNLAALCTRKHDVRALLHLFLLQRSQLKQLLNIAKSER
ncbi:DUF1007 family protein [Vibrio chagasii]|nr:DUF1007 family protein [Vibrio chagasii]